MGVINSILNALGINSQNNQEIGSFEDQISWTPQSAKPGETVHIHYHGLLQESGANEVYLHYGFDSWNPAAGTVKMEREQDGGFGADIQAQGNHEVNFCFKDSANHWDNNNGYNWNLHLQ